MLTFLKCNCESGFLWRWLSGVWLWVTHGPLAATCSMLQSCDWLIITFKPVVNMIFIQTCLHACYIKEVKSSTYCVWICCKMYKSPKCHPLKKKEKRCESSVTTLKQQKKIIFFCLTQTESVERMCNFFCKNSLNQNKMWFDYIWRRMGSRDDYFHFQLIMKISQEWPR